MSHPSRSQQRFPFRIPVRVQRNNCKLPPITQIVHSIEPEDELNKSTQSISTVDIKHETLPPPIPPTVVLPPPTLPPPSDAGDFWVKLRQHITKETLKIDIYRFFQ
jgi:hypothetical protein